MANPIASLHPYLRFCRPSNRNSKYWLRKKQNRITVHFGQWSLPSPAQGAKQPFNRANDSYLAPEHVKVERHEPSKASIFECPVRINGILEDSQVRNSACKIFDPAVAEGEETWVFGNSAQIGQPADGHSPALLESPPARSIK
jgi:hypothetical protein